MSIMMSKHRFGNRLKIPSLTMGNIRTHMNMQKMPNNQLVPKLYTQQQTNTKYNRHNPIRNAMMVLMFHCAIFTKSIDQS